MAQRFNCDFYDQISGRYTIKIFDDQYIGDVTEIRTSSEEIGYEPDIQLYAPIIPVSLSIGLVLNQTQPEAPAIESFLEDMVEEEEGRFWASLEVFGEDEIFRGVLLIEEVKIPNAIHSEVNLTFVDGLSLLKEVPYKTTSDTFFDPAVTDSLWGHIKNCLRLMQSYDKYGASDRLINVIFQWTHTDMLAGSQGLLNIRCKHDLFTSIDDDGNTSSVMAWDVLTTILRPFFLTLAFDPSEKNNYILTHYYNIVSLTPLPAGIQYSADFSIGVSSIQDRSNDAVNLVGGVFGFEKGLRAVRMDFEYQRSGISKFNTNETEPVDYVSYAKYKVTSAEEKIILWGTLNTFWDSMFTFWKVWGLFNIYIKVVGPTSTYYWSQPNDDQTTNQYGFVDWYPQQIGTWETVEEPTTIRTSSFNWRASQHALNDIFVDVVTNPLNEVFNIGDDIEVLIKFEKLGMCISKWAVNQNTQSAFDIVEYNRRIRIALIDGTNSVETSTEGLTIEGLFNNNNSKVENYDIKLGFGDSAGESNLEVNTASGWIASSNKWKKTTGEYYLYELVLQELYSLRKNTRKGYEGQFRGARVYGLSPYTITHTTTDQDYFPVRGKHNIGESTFEGQFIQPVTFLGSPDISIVKKTTASSTSSASTSGPSAPTTTGDPNSLTFEVVPFKITGVTGSGFIVPNVVPIDDTDIEDEGMEIFVQVRRRNTQLTYQKITPDRMSFNISASGANTLVVLGRDAEADEVFTGWVAKAE
jgi:hypothetical protein